MPAFAIFSNALLRNPLVPACDVVRSALLSADGNSSAKMCAMRFLSCASCSKEDVMIETLHIYIFDKTNCSKIAISRFIWPNKCLMVALVPPQVY